MCHLRRRRCISLQRILLGDKVIVADCWIIALICLRAEEWRRRRRRTRIPSSCPAEPGRDDA